MSKVDFKKHISDKNLDRFVIDLFYVMDDLPNLSEFMNGIDNDDMAAAIGGYLNRKYIEYIIRENANDGDDSTSPSNNLYQGMASSRNHSDM